MKKLITTVLITAVAASMSLTAFAANTENSGTINNDNGSKDITVNAKYVDNTATRDVISADIEWGAMEFTYTVGGTKKWDAENHKYTVENSTSGWSENGNTIKVTNHSNVDINANFSYTKDANNTLDGSFTYGNGKTAANGTVKLNAGVENQKDSADYVIATLTLSGTPSNTMKTLTKVGTVTVKITGSAVAN